MRKSLAGIVLVSAFVFPLAAHADPIDDFVLTGGGHTISYSLPATSTFLDFSLFNFFMESAPTTIDGVSGYVTQGDYYVCCIPTTLILSVPSSIFGTPALYLGGPEFFSTTFEPQPEPAPYTGLVISTFKPGTYTLLGQSNFLQPLQPPVDYTLTITQETPAATTPEPSTLALLGTGILGLIGIKRRSAEQGAPS